MGPIGRAHKIPKLHIVLPNIQKWIQTAFGTCKKLPGYKMSPELIAINGVGAPRNGRK